MVEIETRAGTIKVDNANLVYASNDLLRYLYELASEEAPLPWEGPIDYALAINTALLIDKNPVVMRNTSNAPGVVIH